MEKQHHGHASRDSAIPSRPEERGFPRSSVSKNMQANNINLSNQELERVSSMISELYDVLSKHNIPMMIAVREESRFTTAIACKDQFKDHQIRLMNLLLHSEDTDDFLKSLMISAQKAGHSSKILKAMGINQAP